MPRLSAVPITDVRANDGNVELVLAGVDFRRGCAILSHLRLTLPCVTNHVFRQPSRSDEETGAIKLRESPQRLRADKQIEDKAGKDKTPAKPPGKRPGMPGHWRRQSIVVSREVEHLPMVCKAGQAVLDAERKGRHVSARHVFELDRGEMGLQVTASKHNYFAASCACGHETAASPGVGLRSQIEGRKRDLQLSERCLVGPMLAMVVSTLALRFRLSRPKVQEFLLDWLGLELEVATINRCIHEFGWASEPVVKELIEEVRASEVVHLDETPGTNTALCCGCGWR